MTQDQKTVIWIGLILVLLAIVKNWTSVIAPILFNKSTGGATAQNVSAPNPNQPAKAAPTDYTGAFTFTSFGQLSNTPNSATVNA